jgi:hypothetical protein
VTSVLVGLVVFLYFANFITDRRIRTLERKLKSHERRLVEGGKRPALGPYREAKKPEGFSKVLAKESKPRRKLETVGQVHDAVAQIHDKFRTADAEAIAAANRYLDTLTERDDIAAVRARQAEKKKVREAEQIEKKLAEYKRELAASNRALSKFHATSGTVSTMWYRRHSNAEERTKTLAHELHRLGWDVLEERYVQQG